MFFKNVLSSEADDLKNSFIPKTIWGSNQSGKLTCARVWSILWIKNSLSDYLYVTVEESPCSMKKNYIKSRVYYWVKQEMSWTGKSSMDVLFIRNIWELYIFLFPLINPSYPMWEYVTRHWIFSTEKDNFWKYSETTGTFLYLFDRGRCSWCLLPLSIYWTMQNIITYVTTSERERRAQRILFSPTFSNDLQRCKIERSLKASS